MNNDCDRVWTREFLKANFTTTFINGDYKKHREEVLFNNEKAMLPATQPLVERKKLEIRVQAEIAELRKQEKEIKAKISNLYVELYRTNTRQPATERAEFVRACPVDNCRGFLSTQWKCGVCDNWTCPDCHEVKGAVRDAEHTCNPDNVATAALLARDTKNCPKCGVGIHKIDGCDQMWCVQCHTAFSWRTGRIETNIHNPHYYEWMRRTGGEVPRNPLDVPCGRPILGHRFTVQIIRAIDRLKKTAVDKEKDAIAKKCLEDTYKAQTDTITSICRNAAHIQEVFIPRFVTDRFANNQNLRIEYMMGNLTEEKFKKMVQQNDKKVMKYRELHNVFTLLRDTVLDILMRFNAELVENRFRPELLNEINAIVEYCNGIFLDISRVYDGRAYTINGVLHCV